MEFVEGLERWIDKYAELTLSKEVVTGKLRFVGKTRFGGKDTWVGVQLPKPEGKHSGTVRRFSFSPTSYVISNILHRRSLTRILV